MQRESLDKQSSRMNAQQKEMLLHSQQQLEDSAKIIEARRQLPATRRYIFYLDPQLHYAVRRLDQSYGADTLLSRSDCTQFEQIPGLALWLPKKIEIQLHEFDSVPGTIFKDSFLSFITTVSSMSGDRISDDAFKLDYESVPGTIVRDGTVCAKSAKAGDNYVTYTVPTRTQDLPQVIERASSGENIAAPCRRAAPGGCARRRSFSQRYAADDRALQCGAAGSFRGVRCLAPSEESFRINGSQGTAAHPQSPALPKDPSFNFRPKLLPARLNSIGRQVVISALGPHRSDFRDELCPSRASKERSPKRADPGGETGHRKNGRFFREFCNDM